MFNLDLVAFDSMHDNRWEGEKEEEGKEKEDKTKKVEKAKKEKKEEEKPKPPAAQKVCEADNASSSALLHRRCSWSQEQDDRCFNCYIQCIFINSASHDNMYVKQVAGIIDSTVSQSSLECFIVFLCSFSFFSK